MGVNIQMEHMRAKKANPILEISTTEEGYQLPYIPKRTTVCLQFQDIMHLFLSVSVKMKKI